MIRRQAQARITKVDEVTAWPIWGDHVSGGTVGVRVGFVIRYLWYLFISAGKAPGANNQLLLEIKTAKQLQHGTSVT